MSSSAGTYVLISWDTSDSVLLTYYLITDEKVRLSGYYSIKAESRKIVGSILKMAKKFNAEKIIVQNSLGLSKERVQNNGPGSSDDRKWLAKLRKVDQVFDLLVHHQKEIKCEIVDHVKPFNRCSWGKFVRIYESGDIVFENFTLKLPRSFLDYAAYVYESFIVPGITLVKKIDGHSDPFIELAGLRINVPHAELPEGYMIAWIKKEEAESIDVDISYGRTRSAALRKHRRGVIRSMIKWINASKNISFITALINLDHNKFNEFVRKHRALSLRSEQTNAHGSDNNSSGL
ncbi:MAG: hypothetical protein ACP5LW_01430 [Nitrososphaeria archaeon]